MGAAYFLAINVRSPKALKLVTASLHLKWSHDPKRCLNYYPLIGSFPDIIRLELDPEGGLKTSSTSWLLNASCAPIPPEYATIRGDAIITASGRLPSGYCSGAAHFFLLVDSRSWILKPLRSPPSSLAQNFPESTRSATLTELQNSTFISFQCFTFNVLTRVCQ